MTITDLTAQRLDLAGTRAFSAPGAGGPRRETLTTFGRDWLQDIWSQATRGGRVEGVALAAVGSFARREAGPLSDFDLVLLHYGRSLTTAAVTDARRPALVPDLGRRRPARPQRAHRHPVPQRRLGRPVGRGRPARPGLGGR